MSNSYQDRYTWNYFRSLESGDVLIHTDESVSVAFTWCGMQTSLEADSKIQHIFNNVYAAYHELPFDESLVIENHFLRDYTTDVCSKYVSYGEKQAVRHQAFGLALRKDIADFYTERAMTNTLVTVITIAKHPSPLTLLFPKRSIKKSIKEGEKLLNIVSSILPHFEKSKLLTHQEFEKTIWSYYHRDKARAGDIPPPNPRFKLSDRVAFKPEYEDGFIKVGDNYTKCILLLDYPDAPPNWFYCLANSAHIELEVVQIIKPTDVGRAMLVSASQTRRSAESASSIGGESVAEKVEDHNNYRRFISKNKLHTYNNAYIIKLHSPDKNYLKDYARNLIKNLGAGVLIAQDNQELSFSLWRVSQPGQGHKSPFMRQDHTYQVANMAPYITFSGGDSVHRQMLRLTHDSQAITYSYPPGGTNHALTTAKTGSGKGVETVAQIVELYPLGINFYIAEVGNSYKWTVEAFGGDYFDLTPDSVISPFPEYALADSNKEIPLDSDIIAPTINALLPLIGEGSNQSQHIISVGEQIMLELYSHEALDGLLSPTLANFYDCAVSSISHFTGVQKDAAQIIVNNLNSFLSSTTGSAFEKADSLRFTSGIVGVNFKGLMGNDRLSKFLLVFIALRFKHLAFSNATPTRILIDELHEFARIDPYQIKILLQQLTRMGRKEAGAFHGISQETIDAALEEGILNQITHRYFMYLQDGHEDAAKLFGMNSPVLSRWKSYRDPEALGSNMNYRQCIRQYGQTTHDLHLEFPQSLLDLAHSSPRALEIKNHIGKLTTDPFERLRLFREALESSEVFAA